MKGRTLMIVAGLALAVFTGGLWYTQFYAYYEDLPEPVDGLLMGRFPLEDWQAIQGSSSPLKNRVCARISAEHARTIEDEEVAQPAGEPLVAPPWFECFDAKQISRDLEAGQANFYMVGPSGSEGIDEVMAVYPDGRVFMWRQLDARFAK